MIVGIPFISEKENKGEHAIISKAKIIDRHGYKTCWHWLNIWLEAQLSLGCPFNKEKGVEII